MNDENEDEEWGSGECILEISKYIKTRPTRSDQPVNEMSRGQTNDPGPSDTY